MYPVTHSSLHKRSIHKYVFWFHYDKDLNSHEIYYYFSVLYLIHSSYIT